jgi:hypothetical protein
LSRRVSGSMGVRNNKEEVDGVRRKILNIEKRREKKPEEREGLGKISEVEGGREKRKRNREGGKDTEVMGSGTVGEEMKFAELEAINTQHINLKTGMKDKRDSTFINRIINNSDTKGVKAL